MAKVLVCDVCNGKAMVNTFPDLSELIRIPILDEAELDLVVKIDAADSNAEFCLHCVGRLQRALDATIKNIQDGR